MGSKKLLLSLLFAILTPFIITGCENEVEKRTKILKSMAEITQRSLKTLEKRLEDQNIPYAGVLREYAALVGKMKPEYQPIAELLSKESTTEGSLFNSLRTRLNDANAEIPTAAMQKPHNSRLYEEYDAILAATKPGNFEMALTDPINVLADMSGGTLGRIGALNKEESEQENGADDLGAGSQLVGNPAYGSWQYRSNGTSFWGYYGQYRLFSDLVGGNSVNYDTWSQRRDYSYYHDSGRDYYTSPSQKTTQSKVHAAAEKRSKFSAAKKTFNSPYANRKKSTAGPIVATPGKFNSGYANSQRSKKSPAGTKPTSSWGSYNSKNMSSGSRSARGGK